MTEPAAPRCHTLERAQTVPAALERVFPFFECPENLALVTPSWLAFRLVTPTPVSMREGCIIDYRLRLCGLHLRWRSRITDYDPPHGFVDEQVQGPYACWRHTHRFASCAQGTILEDRVVYALPAGLPRFIQDAVHGAYVRPRLEAIFDYRARFYAGFFHGRRGRPALRAMRPPRVLEGET
jgi:hypothetical protein